MLTPAMQPNSGPVGHGSPRPLGQAAISGTESSVGGGVANAHTLGLLSVLLLFLYLFTGTPYKKRANMFSPDRMIFAIDIECFAIPFNR